MVIVDIQDNKKSKTMVLRQDLLSCVESKAQNKAFRPVISYAIINVIWHKRSNKKFHDKFHN